MLNNRRGFFKKLLAGGTGWLLPIIGHVTLLVNQYEPIDFDDAMAKIVGGNKLTSSDKIQLKIPAVAENGSIVPITIHSKIKHTEAIFIIGTKNPVPLIAQLNFTPKAIGQVTTRIKLANTGDVVVIVRADDKLYSVRRKVKVTKGGCS